MVGCICVQVDIARRLKGLTSFVASSYQELIRDVLVAGPLTIGERTYSWAEGEGLGVHEGGDERFIPVSRINRGVAEEFAAQALRGIQQAPASSGGFPARALTMLISAVDREAFSCGQGAAVVPPAIGGVQDIMRDATQLTNESVSEQAREHHRVNAVLDRALLSGDAVLLRTSLSPKEVRAIAGDGLGQYGDARVIGAVRAHHGEAWIAVLPTAHRGLHGVRELVTAAQSQRAVLYDGVTDRHGVPSVRDAVTWGLLQEPLGVMAMVRDGLEVDGVLSLGAPLFQRASERIDQELSARHTQEAREPRAREGQQLDRAG